MKVQVKEVWRKHKGKIILVTSAIGLITIGVVLNRKSNKAYELEQQKVLGELESAFNSTDDGERDIIMNFTDAESGEVLWKDLCSEEYMNDMKDCGMQYENIRKLNGIEEA